MGNRNDRTKEELIIQSTVELIGQRQFDSEQYGATKRIWKQGERREEETWMNSLGKDET